MVVAGNLVVLLVVLLVVDLAAAMEDHSGVAPPLVL